MHHRPSPVPPPHRLTAQRPVRRSQARRVSPPLERVGDPPITGAASLLIRSPPCRRAPPIATGGLRCSPPDAILERAEAPHSPRTTEDSSGRRRPDHVQGAAD